MVTSMTWAASNTKTVAAMISTTRRLAGRAASSRDVLVAVQFTTAMNTEWTAIHARLIRSPVNNWPSNRSELETKGASG